MYVRAQKSISHKYDMHKHIHTKRPTNMYTLYYLHKHMYSCRESEQRYITVLYNDEIHSYDDVIGALTRTDVGMDQMGAVTMASNVDSMVSLYQC